MIGPSTNDIQTNSFDIITQLYDECKKKVFVCQIIFFHALSSFFLRL